MQKTGKTKIEAAELQVGTEQSERASPEVRAQSWSLAWTQDGAPVLAKES